MKSSLYAQLKTATILKENRYRTHHCNELREADAGTTVTLCGWVHSIRDHGGVIFIMLRDQYGLTQLVVSASDNSKVLELCEHQRVETVLRAHGQVRERSPETINSKLDTGAIELALDDVEVLNHAQTLPFEINQETLVKDESIKYRYLYLRRMSVKDIFIKRSTLTMLVRTFLTQKGFLELETPLLTKTTPEGARDFLVPSRVYPGSFYALPQSPQQYKQLLMVSGFDKYFQIARALRDEDSRADRQAEHTQIDMEMAFIERDNIIALLEELVLYIQKELFPEVQIPQVPFPRLTYKDCIEKYGTDKPDLRFPLIIHNVSEAFATTNFNIFKTILKKTGSIRALKIPNRAQEPRSQLDALIDLAVEVGLKGLVWAIPPQNQESGWRASSGKVIADSEFTHVAKLLDATAHDLILIAGDSHTPTLLETLGKLRSRLGHHYGLMTPHEAHFAFVIDFPLLNWNAPEKRWDPLHHMFVRPQTEADIHLIMKTETPAYSEEIAQITSTQVDMVANGYELCSGSERIYTRDLQQQVMKLIGLSDEEIQTKFNHLLTAFDYGAPPHGGAAPGLDRLLMVFTEITNIREVIVFPKTQRGQDLMMESPSPAHPAQLSELALKLDEDKLSPERLEELKTTQTFQEKTF